MKIADLSAPVTAAKSDWLPGVTYLGFTPANGTSRARASREATIQSQIDGGYVLEYVTKKFDEPNSDFLDDPRIRKEKEEHAKVAGKFIAIHKLRHSSRPLREIVGDDEYELLQDMWAQGGDRHRWSVAFPIVETFKIIDPPDAKELLGDSVYRPHFAYSSSVLRPLNDEARQAIADLEIERIDAPNAWIAIEDEIRIAEHGGFPDRTKKLIDRDLRSNALEGHTEERKVKIRVRAAWLANNFWLKQFKDLKARCAACGFDPVEEFGDRGIKLKTLLDVHHKNPLAEGTRLTTFDDLVLLCPTCHRIEHKLLDIGETLLGDDLPEFSR